MILGHKEAESASESDCSPRGGRAREHDRHQGQGRGEGGAQVRHGEVKTRLPDRDLCH